MTGALAALLASLLSLAPGSPGAGGPRESLTLLLGEDPDPAHPMFANAGRYFREDPVERTDLVEDGCRSLREVRDRLARHQGPWGVVNLVVHGSALGHVDLPVTPGGAGLTEAVLGGALTRGLLAPLPPEVADERTEIRIHGCGLGRRPSLLAVLARVLGGRGPRRPVLVASPHFTCFEAAADGSPAIRRFLADPVEVVVPLDEAPTEEALAARFVARAPRLAAEAREALGRDRPRWPGDLFRQCGPVGFLWTRIYAGAQAPPDLAGRAVILRLLDQRMDHLQVLAQADIPRSALTWRADRSVVQREGAPVPALVVQGQGTAHRLLRVLAAADGGWRPWDTRDARLYLRFP